MNHQRICLECNIQLEEKTKYFVCPICGYSEKKYEWYRELLKEDYWCQNALTEYPIIIREKYLSIKSNIEEGQIPAAWLMLRDLFEITLKLPFLLLLSKDMEMDNIPFDTIKGGLYYLVSVIDLNKRQGILNQTRPHRRH